MSPELRNPGPERPDGEAPHWELEFGGEDLHQQWIYGRPSLSLRGRPDDLP